MELVLSFFSNIYTITNNIYKKHQSPKNKGFSFKNNR